MAVGGAPVTLVGAGGSGSTGSVGTEENPLVIQETAGGWTYYFAYTTGYAGYTAMTDMLELVCPAGKEIQVVGAVLSGNATAAALVNVMFVHRSAADTGGTSSNATIGKYSSLDAASGATVKIYTAAPVLGALFADISEIRGSIAATTGAPTQFRFDSTASAQGPMSTHDFAPTLHAGQSFAFNWAGAALPAGFIAQVAFTWRERAA